MADKKTDEKVLDTKTFLEKNVGKKFTVDSTGTIKGEIIKDYGFLKKGHVQGFSHIVFEMYKDLGIVKKVD